MSSNASPSHCTENSFLTETNFKVEINQKMKVPDKISFNTDFNEGSRNSWAGDNIDMNVPERILVAGQHQHVGTRAPPREIVFDNSLLATDPYQMDLPRVATPPRTLTLDKYPFPGIEKYEEEEQVLHFKPNAKVHINDVSNQIYSTSLREPTPPTGGNNESLTSAEEVLHLRRQLAKLNRRIMALELENLNRLQKEKFILGFGIAYFLLKVIIWMNRE